MNFTPRTYLQHLSMVPSPNQVPTLGLPRPSCVHGPSSWSPKRLWSPDHQVSRSPLPQWWKKHPIIRPMSLFLESQFNKEWLVGFSFLRILNQKNIFNNVWPEGWLLHHLSSFFSLALKGCVKVISTIFLEKQGSRIKTTNSIHQCLTVDHIFPLQSY